MLLSDSQATNNVQQPAAGGTDTGETFIQRMKRLNGQNQASMAGVPTQGQQTSPYMQAQTGYYRPRQSSQQSNSTAVGSSGAQAPQGNPSTPVTGNGKIPDPAPIQAAPAPQPSASATTPAPQVPQAAPGPQFAPGWQDAGNGMVRNTSTGQVVPTNHPIYQQALGQAGMGGSTSSTSTSSSSSSTTPGQVPVSGPIPQRPDSTNIQPVDLGSDPYSVYRAANINQFNAPDQSAIAGGQANLAQSILGNPEAMPPDVINAMKNSNKETALLQAKQDAMRANSDAASRGVTDSGTLNRIYDTANSNILANNRQIDTDAAQTNFADRNAALSAVDQILNSGMNRATSAYQTGLAGQTTQANQNAAAVQSQNDAKNAALQRALSQFGINSAIAGNAQTNYNTDTNNYFTDRSMKDAEQGQGVSQSQAQQNIDLQKTLGLGGLTLDQQRLAAANSQFGQTYGLDILKFLEQQREANNNLGFNYSQLNSSGQNNLMNQILSMVQ